MKNRKYRPEELSYEKKIVILSDQVDMTRRLRMSELFRILEEVSVAHTEALGCTRSETLDRGLLWIITRQLAEIEEMPVYDDEITVRGWQGDMMHLFFPRFYEVEKAGKVIIRAQALWALMDVNIRSLILPEDYDIDLPGLPGAGDMMLPAIIIPESAGGPAVSTELVTSYSQMDINGHMNNTGYFDTIDNAVWSDVSHVFTTDTDEAARIMPVPKSAYINYNNEVPVGTHLTLDEYRDGGTRYFEGRGTDTGRVYFRVRYKY